MSEWIQDPFKSVIAGTAIIFVAVGSLTLGMSFLSSIV